MMHCLGRSRAVEVDAHRDLGKTRDLGAAAGLSNPDPSAEIATVLADDLSRPHEIAFSNDESQLYLTDSSWSGGDGRIQPDGPRNVC